MGIKKILFIVLVMVYFEVFHYIHDIIDVMDKSYAFEVSFAAGVLVTIVTMFIYENLNKEK